MRYNVEIGENIEDRCYDALKILKTMTNMRRIMGIDE